MEVFILWSFISTNNLTFRSLCNDILLNCIEYLGVLCWVISLARGGISNMGQWLSRKDEFRVCAMNDYLSLSFF